MLTLNAIAEHIPRYEIDLPVDRDFIVSFLAKLYPQLPRQDLAQRVSDAIAASGPKGRKA